MLPLKQSTAGQKVPVILKDSAGVVVTGVTAPTITVSKAMGDLAAVHDGTWAEKAGGLYSVQLDATDTDTVGALVVRVVKAGCVDSFVCCWVRANTEADNYGRLGTPTGASIAADIAARAAAATALSNAVWTDAKAGYLTGAVALEATLTAIKGAGWTTETLTAIDALIDAVKAKTDLIPASPATEANVSAALVQATLARRLLQNKLTINLTESRAELYADDGLTLYATAALTDSAGDAVTAATTGPINRGPWEIAT